MNKEQQFIDYLRNEHFKQKETYIKMGQGFMIESDFEEWFKNRAINKDWIIKQGQNYSNNILENYTSKEEAREKINRRIRQLEEYDEIEKEQWVYKDQIDELISIKRVLNL